MVTISKRSKYTVSICIPTSCHLQLKSTIQGCSKKHHATVCYVLSRLYNKRNGSYFLDVNIQKSAAQPYQTAYLTSQAV